MRGFGGGARVPCARVYWRTGATQHFFGYKEISVQIKDSH
jgi:hypothetical protein